MYKSVKIRDQTSKGFSADEYLMEQMSEADTMHSQLRRGADLKKS